MHYMLSRDAREVIVHSIVFIKNTNIIHNVDNIYLTDDISVVVTLQLSI